MTCTETGCGGTVVAGYCDTCGTAPAAESRSVADHGPARSTCTESSSRATRNGSSKSATSRGRLGAGVVAIPRIPKGDPATAILVDPEVPERQRFCGNPGCGNPVGRGGMVSRDARRLLHPVRHPILVRPQAVPRRPRRRAVRGAGLHRARRTRLDLPGHRPQRAQPLGGAQGPGQLRRRRRHGRRRRRSSGPRRGGTPEHRPHLQLRRARRRRRHAGRYIVMEYVGGTSLKQIRQAAQRASAAAIRPSPTSSRSRRRSAICTTKAWPTATSSRTT